MAQETNRGSCVKDIPGIDCASAEHHVGWDEMVGGFRMATGRCVT